MKFWLCFNRPVLLLLLLSCCWITGFSQDVYSIGGKVTIHTESQTADVVLRQLGRLSGYTFSYDADALRQTTITHMDFKDEALGHVLRWLNNSYHLDFVLIDKTISARASAPRPRTSRTVVTGRLTDQTGQPLAGADITVKGSREATLTGVDGKFSIETIEPRPILIFSIVGYKTRTIEITNNQPLMVTLNPDVRTMGSVTVSVRKKVNNEISLLNERKNAAVVSDGISAQQIERTASITTTQALQRVVGVTITDDKYVAVRGLGDRSVIAELNGARLSSSDPDRSVVPLDLVPASLLDNVTVYKTLTPDHPADASAGIIELKTKSVPDSLTLQFSIQGGFNTAVGLGGKYNGFYHDNLGFWGQRVSEHDLTPAFLDLNKQYPGGLLQIQEELINSRQSPQAAAEAYRINSIMQGFDPVLTASYQKAAPNQIYAVTAGNSYHLFGGHPLGVVLSTSYYQRTEDIYQGELTQYSLYQGVVTGSPAIYSPMHIPNFITPDFPRLGKYLSYSENTGKTMLNYGLLGAVSYRFSAGHEIQFQYLGSRGAEAQGSNLSGAWDNTGLNYPVYNLVNQLRMSHRVFNTYNLQGEHRLLPWKWKWSPRLSYNLSSSKSTQNEPDFRFTDLADLHTTRFQDPNGVGIGSDTYAFVFGTVNGLGLYGGTIGADPNGRRYRNLTETNYNAKADLTVPFTIAGLAQILKFGGNYLKRKRDFSENILGIPGTTLGGDNGLLQQVNGNLNQLVSYQNIGLQDPSTYDGEGAPRVGGFLYQTRKSPNNYTGSYETDALYAMLDAHITNNIRLTGGVRFESTDIQAHVDTTNVYNPLNANGTVSGSSNLSFSTSQPNTGYSTNYKPYYSGNLTYTFHRNMNFRLAYSTSLARPELRELTNIYEFDPFQFAVVVGNPTLLNQLTQSADFRWEWFPRPGEVFAVSAFGKRIRHQLTKVFIYNSEGNQSMYPQFPIVEFQNDPEIGKVYGLEFEGRKDLGLLLPALTHFSLGANVMLAASVIDKNPQRLDADRTNDRFSPATSPVFEQAPYSVNAYVDYNHPRYGTDVTVSFNIIGERLTQVQLDGTPDIYDRPVPILDFVFSQRLGKRWLFKGFAKNLLDPWYREVYADPGNDGKFHGTTYIHHQYKKGAELSLGITYNVF